MVYEALFAVQATFGPFHKAKDHAKGKISNIIKVVETKLFPHTRVKYSFLTFLQYD